MRCTNSGGYQGLPPRELELMAEVVSSLEDTPGAERGQITMDDGGT